MIDLLGSFRYTIRMEIFGIEKLSLVDYDGKVAATVFTASCNYRCGFCHNSPLVTNVKSLTSIAESEILQYLTKRKGILDGVCISGGEPTLQRDLPVFCEKIKKLGLCVKLDTNGTNPDMLKTLVNNGLCDYVAMDIKNAKEHYSDIVGISNYDTNKVEQSVEFLLKNHVDYEFRTTLIKDYHTPSDMESIGRWIKGAKKYALQRFKDTGSCILRGLKEIDEERAKEFLSIVLPYVPNTKLRGY